MYFTVALTVGVIVHELQAGCSLCKRVVAYAMSTGGICCSCRLWQQQQQQGDDRTSAKRARLCGQQGINVAIVHPSTGEPMPARAFLALQGRAGDASF
jgi:hypothetical protein